MRNFNKPLLLTILLFCCCVQLRAQFDAHFSHYWALQSYFNPAGIGMAGRLNVVGSYNSQLTGFTRAPKTMYFAGDMPLPSVDNQHNVGAGLFNETIGLFTNQRAFVQYAFRSKQFWGGRLAGGVQVGMLSEKFDGSKTDFGEAEGSAANDPAFPSSEAEGSSLDLGFGLHYLHPLFYIGLSASHLNSPEILLAETNEFQINPTYYLMGGCNIRLKNPLLSIQPSLMVQSDGVSLRTDITGRFTYTYDEKNYYVGLGYSPNISCTVLIGGVVQGINLGYAYELYTGQIGIGHGNHCLFMGYQTDLELFKKGKNKHKSIRIL
ncbi:MAG: PorP/SprF family type IX secretion system membrane protein [Bacteroidaceae bacterium]|nr:PorP/SprF family type IX secretion system membrane protein [Bacteroidaceae bacterium]